MRKIVILAIFLALFGGICAQEIKDFELRYFEKRYEFKLSLPTDNWNSNYDLFIFAREKGTQSYFKANTIMGEFRNLPTGWGKLTVFWDPFFDSRKPADYEFRIYAVPLKFTDNDYYYMGVSQVGELRLFSNLKNAYYELSGKRLQDGDVLALPSGDYEIHVFQDNRLISKNIVSVPAFSTNNADLSPLYGTLKLTSAISGTLYAIDDGNFSPQSEYQLTQGSYVVHAKAMQANPAYPALTAQVRVEIRHDQQSQYFFEFPYGVLNLDSDLEQSSYVVQGRSYTEVRGMMLKPGFVEVLAINRQNPAAMPQNLGLRLEIRQGLNTNHKFNFFHKWGTLKILTKRKMSALQLNDAAVSPQTEYGLPEGTYRLLVTLPGGKKVESGPLEVKAKETTTFDLDKEAAKIGVFAGMYLSIFERADLHYFTPSSSKSKVNHSFALSLSGLQAGYTHTKGPLFLKYYLGLGNKLYCIYSPKESKLSFSSDLISVGATAGIAPFAGKVKLFADVDASYLMASPMADKQFLYAVDYLYITKFSDSGSKGKTSNLAYSLGASATANLEVKPWENTAFYAFAGVKVSELKDGAWYKSGEVKAWKADPSLPKPTKVESPWLPQKNFAFAKSMLDFGLGVRLRF